ncbi:hypothetical protein IL992_39500 [Microbispora sp. NEAU-D428]|uniref:hypothetical protein n=1 Tax=Microbispora sitophila TaxID=2771537 RepID=UPI00186912C3|nr:hypothetical protein [Microbispora sitophila]MBE3015209.1 hypothetical protein [Microbispora sitophila]
MAEHDGKGTVTRPHVFTKPGLYPISVTGAGGRGGRMTADTVKGEKVYVLVHDRSGSLTGTGRLTVPAGTCTVNAACAKEGEASFTVTARYPRKGKTPTGEVSPADKTDQLHLKVWDRKGKLVYDNTGSAQPVSGVIRVSG